MEPTFSVNFMLVCPNSPKGTCELLFNICDFDVLGGIASPKLSGQD